MAKSADRARLELRMRLVSPTSEAIGPGKIALLESIEETGSISAAARVHGMSYSRAWKLVTAVNAAFGEALVVTATGGESGGGATLTPFARELIAAYRGTEAAAEGAASAGLKDVLARLTSAKTRARP